MADEEWTTERWVYMGRRLGRGKSGTTKLFHWFLTEREGDASTVAYDKAMVHPIIGSTYLVEACGSVARVQSGELAKGDDRRQVVDDNADLWRAQDQEASVRKRSESARSRMASNNSDIGALTLRDVKRLMGNAGPSQRAGYVATVLEYLR